jgi:hypothetical protein
MAVAKYFPETCIELHMTQTVVILIYMHVSYV